MRRKHYPRLIAQHHDGWTQEKADEEISVLESIIEDYEKLVQWER